MAQEPKRALPARPSQEHLRKQAKRLAKGKSLGLAEAQRHLAAQYGFASWAELMRAVQTANGGEATPTISSLAEAARDGDVAAVRRLVASEPMDDAALWHACSGDAPAESRIAIVEAVLAAGASPRREVSGETALHAAASRGPLALVETLIRGEALEWQPDSKGRSPLDAARRGSAADKDAIVELLARPVIRDASFRAAVAALHAGNAAELARLLDAEPRLLRERIVEPQCYRDAKRHQYFRDPKLFWFIADNPTLVERMPDNSVELAELMIARGVEQPDLDYALELVMTSSPASEQGLQLPLMQTLLRAGAAPTVQSIDIALGHRETAPVEALLKAGHAMTASIAAALGRIDRLIEMLATAPPEEVQKALGMAVINRQTEAVRLSLDAGADPDGFLPIHQHSLPLHQAAIDETLDIMELLLARGARLDIPDRMWKSTPLGWAIHQGKARSRARLEQAAAARS